MVTPSSRAWPPRWRSLKQWATIGCRTSHCPSWQQDTASRGGRRGRRSSSTCRISGSGATSSSAFIFNFTQRSFIIASRVINDSLPLIRALYFPRAALPLGYVLIELQQLMISMVVLVTIVLATGEPLTWYWLLVIPVLLFQAFFNVGAGLILARIGAGVDDVSQLLPFIVRTWMYTSGVMFSIQTLKNLVGHHKLSYLLQINPAAVYITLTRTALLKSQRLSIPGAAPYNRHLCTLYYRDPAKHIYDSAHCMPLVSNTGLWLYAVGWAVLALIIGFFYFWRAEARYGRG